MHARLGRRHAHDPRDAAYPLRALLPHDEPERTSRSWWAYGTVLDQGDKPMCVAYSWTHMLLDSPTTHKLDKLGGAGFIQEVYDQAQQADEFADTPPADGTSVRAGAKVLQSLGLITAYHWAQTVDDVVHALLYLGAVEVGSGWYDGMFTPAGALCILEPSGGLAGGHAYVLDGVNTHLELVRVKNSWGRGWARNGFAHMTFATLERLLHEDGEACLGVAER